MNQSDEKTPADQTLASRPGDAPSAWDRLNMEGIARRLIQTARMAAAEHVMHRVADAARRRDEQLEQTLILDAQLRERSA